MDHRKKKNLFFGIGILIGIALGIKLHHLGLGIAFGIIMGLAIRETYERRYWNKRNNHPMK